MARRSRHCPFRAGGQRCRSSTSGHESCVECQPRGFRAERPRPTGPAAARTGTAPGRPRLDGAPVTPAHQGSGSALASMVGVLAGTGLGGGPVRSAADRAEHRVIIAVGLGRRHVPRRWRRHRTSDRVGLSPARRDVHDVRTFNPGSGTLPRPCDLAQPESPRRAASTTGWAPPWTLRWLQAPGRPVRPSAGWP